MYTNMSDNLKNGDPSPSVLAMLEKEAKLVTVKKVILVLARSNSRMGFHVLSLAGTQPDKK